MGVEVHQRNLHLSRCWPCSRTRWWCVMTFKSYQVKTLPDLPLSEPQPGPTWPQEVGAQLKLSAEEYEVYMDARFGADQRQFRSDRACPCILHSYGSVLAVCPCGCRPHPFSRRRLERDGIRGFFVQSSVDQDYRDLATKEAALLLTVPSDIKFKAETGVGFARPVRSACPSPVDPITSSSSTWSTRRTRTTSVCMADGCTTVFPFSCRVPQDGPLHEGGTLGQRP